MAKGFRKHLKVILQVYRRDLRRLLHNPLALIVIIGVLFLPSVYAWYTIEANMDPYAHTDAIKVAVVNEDKGTHNAEVGDVDAGEDVVAKLKDNHELGWEFVSKDEAMQRVESGEYFAAIVIPESFSEDLMSVFTGDYAPPTIDYYVNEKVSAVAPEITDVGATTITSSIDSAFIEEVSKTVASTAQTLGDTVRSDESTAQTHLDDAVTKARDSVASLDTALTDFNSTLDDARKNVSDAESALATMNSSLSGLESDEGDAESKLNELRDAVGAFGTTLNQDLQDASAAASAATTAEAAAVAQAESDLAARKTALTDQLNAALSQGEAGAAEAQRLRGEIAAVDAAEQALSAAGAELSDSLQAFSSALSNASSTLSGQTLPALESSLGDASSALGTLKGATTALGPALSTTSTALKQLSTTIDVADGALKQAHASLTDIDQSLEDSANDLAALSSSSTVESLSEYLKIDPQELAEFMAAPVKLETEVVYPVKNYGSGVAPFFTNLALWVAGFILVALLRMRIDRGRKDEEPLPPLTFSETYFGRAALFLTLGLIQGLIVCVGDLVLGIQCDNPAAFIFAGLITVFIDINILYALVFTMRHLGRAIGVIVLIVQIPGSSGEYPVQMMPAFFQFIHPFLPFTYSIDAMREAIGGMYGTHYWIDLLCLLPFLGCALAFGLICGRYSTNLNVLFDRELSRTNLLISEETDGQMEPFRLRSVVQALLASETYHDELIARMERFRKRYPRLIRGGWIFVAVAGVVALVLGRLLGGDIDGKVIALGFVIAVIFVVLAYQIVVAFINDRLAYQLQVSTLETDDLQSMARRHLATELIASEPNAAPAPVVAATPSGILNGVPNQGFSAPASPLVTPGSGYDLVGGNAPAAEPMGQTPSVQPFTQSPTQEIPPTSPFGETTLYQAPYPGAPAPVAPYPGAPVPEPPYPGAPMPAEPPYPGAPMPEVSYPGASPAAPPYPGAPMPEPPYPGAPQPQEPYPGAPVQDFSASTYQEPYPGAPKPDFYSEQYAQAPYPGAPAPEPPYPGAPMPKAAYPGAPLTEPAYPGASQPEPAYPGAPAPAAPYPGAPAPEPPYPGAPMPDVTGQPTAIPPYPGAPMPQPYEQAVPEPPYPGAPPSQPGFSQAAQPPQATPSVWDLIGSGTVHHPSEDEGGERS